MLEFIFEFSAGKRAEFSALFYLFFPIFSCENQTKYWKQQDIDVYNDIKSRADKVKVLAVHYYNGCMQKSRHLVDCSSACICFLTKHEGGTAYTVDYAKQNGLDIINVADRCS